MGELAVIDRALGVIHDLAPDRAAAVANIDEIVAGLTDLAPRMETFATRWNPASADFTQARRAAKHLSETLGFAETVARDRHKITGANIGERLSIVSGDLRGLREPASGLADARDALDTLVDYTSSRQRFDSVGRSFVERRIGVVHGALEPLALRMPPSEPAVATRLHKADLRVLEALRGIKDPDVIGLDDVHADVRTAIDLLGPIRQWGDGSVVLKRGVAG